MRQLSFLAAVISLMMTASCIDTKNGADGDGYDNKLFSYEETQHKWDSLLSVSNFVDAKDIVPTDTAAKDYDDHLRNSEFLRSIVVKYTKDTAYVTTQQSAKRVKVTVNGAHVKLDLGKKKLCVTLIGATEKGSLNVFSENKFQIRLNGVKLKSDKGPAINVQSRKRMFLTLVDGTRNYLSDAKEYTDTIGGGKAKGCVFSNGQIILTGSSLETYLEIIANNSHGINSGQYVLCHPGVRLNILNAPKDGIHADQGFRMTGGLLRIYSQKDAIECDTLGINMTGGRIYLCSKRAYTANPVNISGGGTMVCLTPSEAYIKK